MDNNKASAVGIVKYTKQGGTYYMKMVSDFGDISQKYASYNSDTNTATGITPDFTNDNQQPTIEAYISDSRKAAEVYPNNAKWVVNSVELQFDNAGLSTTAFNGETGHFKRINAVSGKTRAGLKIVKNLVVPFGSAPVSVECTATVANGRGSTKITNSYTIPISENTSNGMNVRISVTNGGILDKDHQRVVLTANIDNTGGGEISSPSYKWEATDENGEFQPFEPAKTSKSIEVVVGDVDNARLYKVTVEGVGSDVQKVEDHTDELRIVPVPTPPEEEILEGSNGSISWAPQLWRGDILVSRYGDGKATYSMKFYSPVGTPINVATEFTITENEVSQNGGANYVITGKLV